VFLFRLSLASRTADPTYTDGGAPQHSSRTVTQVEPDTQGRNTTERATLVSEDSVHHGTEIIL